MIFVLLILLPACSNLGSGFEGFSNLFGRGGEQVGGSGLILKFIEPKSSEIRIPEGEFGAFRVRLQLENYVVNDFGMHGELCLTDTLSDNFGGVTEGQCKPIDLESAKRNERGIMTPTISSIYDFGPYIYKGAVKEFASASQTRIIADIKYETETKAYATMCIQKSSTQSICDEEQSLKVEQSDLPLKISSINARTFSLGETGTNILLEIEVSQTKDGQITTPSFLLSPTQIYPTANFEVSINNVPAKCVELIENNILEITQTLNQKIIKCSARLILNQDYIKEVPIEIKMGYGFIQSVEGPKVFILSKEEALS